VILRTIAANSWWCHQRRGRHGTTGIALVSLLTRAARRRLLLLLVALMVLAAVLLFFGARFVWRLVF
jgi:uncharacterized protein involved in exopolysaccharide biosynthesis